MHAMKTGGDQTGSGRRDLIIGQLSYLIDEIAALGEMLGSFPEGVLTARPYEGQPSILDLLATLAERERTIRIPNVETFVASDDGVLLEAPPLSAAAARASKDAVSRALHDVATARSRLVDLVRECGDSVWERRASLDDNEVTLEEYLLGIIQQDVEVFRVAAQRVYESRPVGSPGFTAR